MKALTLSDRASFIADSLPRDYRKIILNSIIAKSVETGDLAEELFLYLSEEDVDSIMDKIQIKTAYKIQKKAKPKIKPIAHKTRKTTEVNEVFSKGELKMIGFDD